jgi:two-component system phosphate regulon sensor histidine kinase PhoR
MYRYARFLYLCVVLPQKNITPRGIATLIALAVSTLGSLLVGFTSGKWVYAGVAFLVMFATTYYLSFSLISQFIYRKIKLVYKFISQTKATKREEFYNNELLPQKTIDDVNEDVMQWAEERKVEMERLQSNEQFRKEFLMNLAHELRTPIFSSQGYIHTLLDGALDDPNVNVTFLSNAAKSIDRLAELVDDLDIISSMEANRIPIQKSDFIIQELIRDVFDELEQTAKKKNVSLRIKNGCETPLSVSADEAKIRQVLVNLIENSIKYGRENGLTTAGVYIVDGQNVFVEITDNGYGIAEEHIPRVFERFFRTDASRDRNIGGTGLGLSIVKHIIEAHNHTVTCRSKLDVGSSFGFTLDKSAK